MLLGPGRQIPRSFAFRGDHRSDWGFTFEEGLPVRVSGLRWVKQGFLPKQVHAGFRERSTIGVWVEIVIPYRGAQAVDMPIDPSPISVTHGIRAMDFGKSVGFVLVACPSQKLISAD